MQYSNTQIELEDIITRVDHFIENLPEPLKSMGEQFAVSGYPYRKAFVDNDWAFPGLHLPFWITKRYTRISATSSSTMNSTREIVYAALLGYLYIRIQDDVYDYKEGNDSSWLLLANEFIRECFRIYHNLFPAESSFWSYFHKQWLDFSQATAWEIKTCRGNLNLLTDSELLMIGKKLSFAKVPVTAVALKAHREKDLTLLFKIVDLLATSSQLLNDFGSLDRDLVTNHFTYPLSSALESVDTKNDNALKEVIFERLLKKNSMENLFNNIINLDNQILKLLTEFPLPELSEFLLKRLEMVKEDFKLFRRIKLEALFSKRVEVGCK